jgi:tetratricopeptide (TPR) repeat protein
MSVVIFKAIMISLSIILMTAFTPNSAHAQMQINPPSHPAQTDLTYANRLLNNADRLRQESDTANALFNYRRGTEIYARLIEAAPSDFDIKSAIAPSYIMMGDLEFDLDQIENALISYQTGLNLFEAIQAADPTDAHSGRLRALILERLSKAYEEQGDITQAISKFNDNLDVLQQLSQTFPDTIQWQDDLALAHTKMSILLERNEDFETARSHQFTSRIIYERLAEENPDTVRYKEELMYANMKLGASIPNYEYLQDALNIALSLQENDQLQSSNIGLIEDLNFALEEFYIPNE